MTEQVHFRDFTKKRRPVSFTIEDHEFHCVKGLSPKKIQRLMAVIRGSETDETNVLERLEQTMSIFLLPESFDLFKRLVDDDDDPIDLEQQLDILRWAVEVYTGRPLTESPDSSTSSETGTSGTSSTAGAPPEESTP